MSGKGEVENVYEEPYKPKGNAFTKNSRNEKCWAAQHWPANVRLQILKDCFLKALLKYTIYIYWSKCGQLASA